MAFGFIKRAMPRGLYGRAALILLVPIVSLQLVVSAAFLQRYFEDVTTQLMQGVTLELRLVLSDLDGGGGAAVADALDISMRSAVQTTGDRRAFYDLSGRVITRILREDMADVQAVDLISDPRRLQVTVMTPAGDPVMLSVDRRRASATNPHQLLVWMVGTGILMTAVAYLFLRNQLRPIRRIAHAAEAFGKGRIVDYRPAGATEVRSAGRAFLDMRSRIDQQIEQRTLMLSGVSHDLRTPLTRMKLGLSMLEDGPDTAALIRDVNEMEALLSTFLDFARADALDDLAPSDPVAIARRIVDDAGRGGGAITLVAPQTVQLVELRPQAVHRAVSNLVSNALRYGTTARLSVAVMDRALRFTVEDDGPGIAPGDRTDALRPFIRLDIARNQDQGSGVGLGLAIASDIARRHGGTLRLGESADLGGLRVDLVLPR
jgi:two-component system osmolarity sensor histidine kinase EnvZ